MENKRDILDTKISAIQLFLTLKIKKAVAKHRKIIGQKDK